MVYLFGFESPDLAALALRLSGTFQISFELHEAGCHGGNYYRGESEHANWILQANRSGRFGELAEESFPEVVSLLHVESTTGDWIANQVTSRAADAKLLKAVRY